MPACLGLVDFIRHLLGDQETFFAFLFCDEVWSPRKAFGLVIKVPTCIKQPFIYGAHFISTLTGIENYKTYSTQ